MRKLFFCTVILALVLALTICIAAKQKVNVKAPNDDSQPAGNLSNDDKSADGQNADDPNAGDGQNDINPTVNNDNLSIPATYAEEERTKFGWNLLLVNEWNPVPEDYTMTLHALANGHQVDERIYPDLQKMFDDARAAGVHPRIVASYRTPDIQVWLHDQRKEEYIAQGYSEDEASTLADGYVAKPGYSEHQTGLAIDLSSDEDTQETEEAVYDWMAQNCYKYGFILRYPNDKSDITGINFEEWHFRYVGREAAKYIFEHDMVLEEYFNMLMNT